MNRGEIEFRLDPLYFRALKQIETDIVEKAKYPVHPVRQVCAIKRGKFTHRPRNDPKLYDGEYPFIQTGDIVRSATTGNEITYKQTLNELGRMTSRLAYPPQLLMTIAANIGVTAILDYACCYPDSIVAIDPKNQGLNTSIEYLDVYFTLIQPYVEQLAPFAAQRNLNNQQLGDIPLILPDNTIQQKAIDSYKKAVEDKKAKENQAQELLASIDDYLLTELSIVLPPEPENAIENRKFRTNFSSVTGNRFDPKRYSTRTEQLYDSIHNSIFPLRSLKSLLIHTASGQWGDEPHESFNEKLYKQCLVIRSTEFDNRFNLKLDNSRAKYRLITKTKLDKLDLQPYDILVEKSGGSPDQPVGRAAILLPEIFENNTICYSNFIHKFRADQSIIDPEYLFAYLKVIHNIKLTDTMQSQTNGIRNLIMREYWNQEIPIPSPEKQKEIATQFFNLKNEAQELFKNAELDFQQAKKEIEHLILNPANND